MPASMRRAFTASILCWPVKLCGASARINVQRGLMPYSPILVVHICAGTLGLLSGTAAMSFRKGSPRHVLAGRIFVASMLTMAVVAVYLAIVRHQPNNIGGGILTFYLIGTAWLTARRRDGETSRFDWVVLLIPLALGILTWMNGLKVVRSGASSQDGVSRRNDVLHGFRDAAGWHGGRSHVGTRWCFWCKAHRAASLADVLWPVHRSRIFFSGTLEPPTEIAFGSGTRAAPVPGCIRHDAVFNSQHTPTDFADFLANPRALHN